jgi:outer membrane protein assembly factor BamB
LLAALAAGLACAGDWPQFEGPDRNAISKETSLLKSWPEGGPPLVWTFKEAGLGFGGPAVVNDRVYLMGTRQDDEYVFCLDKGTEKWAAKIGPIYDFQGNNWSRGPNATPTVGGDYLLALGSQGELVCVNPADGKEHWRVNLPRDLAAQVNPVTSPVPDNQGWGFCWSPIIDGDQVIITPGGPKGLAAGLNKKDGKLLWRSEKVTDQATYSSPVLAKIHGVKQVIVLVQDGVVGVSAKDGSLLWQYRKENPYPDVVCPTPRIQGDRVYITAWGGGCDLIQLSHTDGKFEAKKVYASKELSNRLGGVVVLDKYLYGSHEAIGWKCQDFATGEIKWSNRRAGYGSVIAAEGMLYCLDDNKGVVSLVEASPKSYKEVSKFTLPELSSKRKPGGRIWTHPVISNGMLYLRDQELVFAYKISR